MRNSLMCLSKDSNNKVLNINSWEFDCNNDKLKFRITISKIINTLQDTFQTDNYFIHIF